MEERERDARGGPVSAWEGERGGEEDGKGRQERIGDERGGGLPPLEWRSGYPPGHTDFYTHQIKNTKFASDTVKFVD